MQFINLGVVPFEEALQRQGEMLQLIARRAQPETVFLLQHPPVFTIGRRGDARNLLRRQDWDGHTIELIRIYRGGDITYHGPGQLVGYPHLDLRRRGRNVHRYLRQLEESLIRTAACWGIEGYRKRGLTGVWTKQGKIASIGVGVRHWITLHGFSLNVSPDLRYFQLIRPCGIPDCPVTSMSRILGRPLEVEQVIPVFKREFQKVLEDPAGPELEAAESLRNRGVKRPSGGST